MKICQLVNHLLSIELTFLTETVRTSSIRPRFRHCIITTMNPPGLAVLLLACQTSLSHKNISLQTLHSFTSLLEDSHLLTSPSPSPIPSSSLSLLHPSPYSQINARNYKDCDVERRFPLGELMIYGSPI